MVIMSHSFSTECFNMKMSFVVADVDLMSKVSLVGMVYTMIFCTCCKFENVYLENSFQ